MGRLDVEICNIYSEWKSSSQLFITGYEGIPQNLVINIICASVCIYQFKFHKATIKFYMIYIPLIKLDLSPKFVIIGFSFARRILWNYGRIALIERNLHK